MDFNLFTKFNFPICYSPTYSSSSSVTYMYFVYEILKVKGKGIGFFQASTLLAYLTSIQDPLIGYKGSV